MSFSSVALPKMMDGATPGDPIQIDLFLGSWIASLFFIGNVIGCLVGGLINQARLVSPRHPASECRGQDDLPGLLPPRCHHLGHGGHQSPRLGHPALQVAQGDHNLGRSYIAGSSLESCSVCSRPMPRFTTLRLPILT